MSWTEEDEGVTEGASSAAAIVRLDNAFTLKDNSDETKSLQFQVSTGTAGVPVVLSIPPASDTIVGTAAAQTLSNKTHVAPVLGTPASGTLTNCTGLPVASGISGLGSGVATFLATPSSANLATAVTGETGSGGLVFDTSPTLVTPTMNDVRGLSRVRGVNTLAPTITFTGFGASGSASLATGSSDVSGRINITTGGAGIAASGTVTITFSSGSAYGTNGTSVVAMLCNGDGTWDTRATLIGSATNTTASCILNWDNDGTTLTNAATYAFHYIVISR